MEIHIYKKQIELLPEAEQYIEKKVGSLDKFLQRFEGKGEIMADVEVSRTTEHHIHGQVYYAEITMHLPNKTLRAEHYDENIEKAIDGVKNKIKAEIMKYRDTHILKRTDE